MVRGGPNIAQDGTQITVLVEQRSTNATSNLNKPHDAKPTAVAV